MTERLRIFRFRHVFYAQDIRRARRKIEDYLLNYPSAPLLLSADTWGGIGSETIAAANAFRQFRGGHITSYVAEECYSSGLLIMACADRRVALRGARFMVHAPMLPIRKWKAAAQDFYGLENMRGILDNAAQGYATYFNFLDERTGKPPGFWRSLAQPEPENRYYSAQEMLDFGLLTHVVDSFADMRALVLEPRVNT